MKFEQAGPPRYKHQQRALRKVIETGGVTALLCDPGTGKTAVTLDYASILTLKNPKPETRVLVICPLVAVDTWVIQSEIYVSEQVNVWAEAIGGSLIQRAMTLAARGGQPFTLNPKTGAPAESMHPSLGWKRSPAWFARRSDGQQVRPEQGPEGLGDDQPRLVLIVTNLDTFTQRTKVRGKTMADVMVQAVKRFAPDMIVVDESHKIKSASGNASRLLARLTDTVKRRLLLTGTVMPHSPMDVYGQWRFLDPYAFGATRTDGVKAKMTYGGFKNRYAQLGGWMGQQIVGFHNLDEMQKIMAKNAVVVKKSEALDLPPTSDVIVPVNLSAAESKAYREMRDQLATQLTPTSQASSTNRLTQMLRLRQITSGHIGDDAGQVQVIGRSKVNTIRSLVHDTLTGESRVVIFCLFISELRELSQSLREKGTLVETISGATPNEERIRIRKKFGSDDPERIVLVAQIKTLSLAVNELVTASHAIFASLSQQRDDYIQARDRLDRIGQTKPVTFWHAVAPGTVDEVILKSHQERTDLENAMLKHIHEGR